MIAPGSKCAGTINGTLKIMESCRPVKIVPHIVFAGPKQLDGRAADNFGDPCTLDRVIVRQPPAKTAAHAWKMHGDVAFGNAERLGHLLQATLWRLTRHPKLQLAIRELCRAVLRLQGRMGDEGIKISGFHNLVALLEN